VIADKDALPGAKDDGYHALGLRRLRGLVDEHGAEAQLGQARVASADTCAADDVCAHEQLPLADVAQRTEALLVGGRQLALLLL